MPTLTATNNLFHNQLPIEPHIGDTQLLRIEGLPIMKTFKYF